MGVNWRSVTRENNWTFGLLIREPLDRYLSAFLNKCNPLKIPWGNDKNCAGPPWPKGASLETVLEFFEQHALRQGPYNVSFERAQEPHFLPQIHTIRQCGLKQFSPDQVESVANLSDHSNFYKDVKAMLQKAGVGRASELAERYFGNHSLRESSKWKSRLNLRPEKFFEVFYRSPRVRNALMAYYAEDYKRLGVPTPKFAFEAVARDGRALNYLAPALKEQLEALLATPSDYM
jgi:hypothetical protein